VRKAFTLVELMVVCAILAIILTIAVPAWVKSRENSRRSACLSNMQKIEQAKDIWSMENRQSTGAVVTEADIAPQFIKGYMPPCPAGGTYTIGVIGTPPSCTQHGVLP
jgi:prepilin-type N-terminal cleavage/methylation domain-containing protein